MDETMRQARDRYFVDNRFGPDGGYASKWVDFKLGKLPVPFPNTPARVRAVKFHDLHHVLTGYRTDLIGEFEISGWEIGAGCHGFAAAWYLNLMGMIGGLTRAPRLVWRAFLRGRHSRTLYPLPFEPLLDRTVAELRQQTGVDRPRSATTLTDVALFAAAVLAGLGLTAVTVAVVLTPVTLVAWLVSFQLWRREQSRATESVAS